jgi:hypothetical protein
MDNPVKLSALDTQDENKQNKNITQYVLETTMHKQTQITQIRHGPSYKQLEVTTNPELTCWFFVVSVLLIFLVFCVVLLCFFTLSVQCREVRYDFHIKTVFGSSLPLVVCKTPAMLLMNTVKSGKKTST